MFAQIILASVLSLAVVSWQAHAQTKPKHYTAWDSCGDGDKACNAFCTTNNNGPSCWNDCTRRINECRSTGYYKWGANGELKVGPLTP